MKKIAVSLVALAGVALSTQTVALADTTNANSQSSNSNSSIQNNVSDWANFTNGSKVVYLQNPAGESGEISNNEASLISSLPQSSQKLFSDFINARANSNTNSFMNSEEGQELASFLKSNPKFAGNFTKASDANNPEFTREIKPDATGTHTTYVFPDGSEAFVSADTTLPPIGVDPTTTFTYGWTDYVNWWYCNLIADWTLKSGLIVDVSDTTGAFGAFGIGLSGGYNGDAHVISNNTTGTAVEATYTVHVDPVTTTELLKIKWSEGSPTGYLISGGGGSYGKITTS